jgi:hypothetical protein
MTVFARKPDPNDQIREIYDAHYIGRSESAAECAALLNYASGASFIAKCQALGLRTRSWAEGQKARHQHGQPWVWDEEAAGSPYNPRIAQIRAIRGAIEKLMIDAKDIDKGGIDSQLFFALNRACLALDGAVAILKNS